MQGKRLIGKWNDFELRNLSRSNECLLTNSFHVMKKAD
jgi:hypothetical protein